MCPNVNSHTYVSSYKVIWITVEMEDRKINDRVFYNLVWELVSLLKRKLLAPHLLVFSPVKFKKVCMTLMMI